MPESFRGEKPDFRYRPPARTRGPVSEAPGETGTARSGRGVSELPKVDPVPVPDRLSELPGNGGSGPGAGNGDQDNGDGTYYYYYFGYPWWSCYWGHYWYPWYHHYCCYYGWWGYYPYCFGYYWPYFWYWNFCWHKKSHVVYVPYTSYTYYVASQDAAVVDTGAYDPYSTEAPPPLSTGAKELLDSGARLFREGNYLEAVSMFRRAVLADLKSPLPKFIYAHALFALGIYDSAAAQIRLGLALMPEWPEQGGDLKQLYGDPKDFDEQLAVLKSHLKVRGTYNDALLVLGYVSYFTGDLYLAEKAFEKLAQASSPDHASAAGLFLASIAKIKATLPGGTDQEGQPLDDGVTIDEILQR